MEEINTETAHTQTHVHTSPYCPGSSQIAAALPVNVWTTKLPCLGEKPPMNTEPVGSGLGLWKAKQWNQSQQPESGQRPVWQRSQKPNEGIGNHWIQRKFMGRKQDLLFSTRHLEEFSVPQFVPFRVTLGQVTHPIHCTSLTYLKQCNVCVQTKPKSLLSICSYQKPSHTSTEMQTLLCRYQTWRNQADRILSSISTSGPEEKEATAHHALTFFTFGRSQLFKKQTNNALKSFLFLW